MVGLLRILLRLRRGGWGIFRRRTWGCRPCSCERVGSGYTNFSSLYSSAVCAALTLPFRSRKKRAEAMVEDCVRVQARICDQELERGLEDVSELLIASEMKNNLSLLPMNDDRQHHLSLSISSIRTSPAQAILSRSLASHIIFVCRIIPLFFLSFPPTRPTDSATRHM